MLGIRQGIREWIDFIDDDGIGYFVNNFFNINIIELSADETRLKIQTGRTIKEDNDFDSMTDDEIDEFYDGIFQRKVVDLEMTICIALTVNLLQVQKILLKLMV